jgi:hypothetical protein
VFRTVQAGPQRDAMFFLALREQMLPIGSDPR